MVEIQRREAKLRGGRENLLPAFRYTKWADYCILAWGSCPVLPKNPKSPKGRKNARPSLEDESSRKLQAKETWGSTLLIFGKELEKTTYTLREIEPAQGNGGGA